MNSMPNFCAEVGENNLWAASGPLYIATDRVQKASCIPAGANQSLANCLRIKKDGPKCNLFVYRISCRMKECIPEFNAWLRIFGHISGYGDLCHRWAWVGGGDCWPVTSMASRGSFLGAPDKWPAPCKGWYLLTWRLICVVSQNLLSVVFRDSTPCNIYLLQKFFLSRDFLAFFFFESIFQLSKNL